MDHISTGAALTPHDPTEARQSIPAPPGGCLFVRCASGWVGR